MIQDPGLAEWIRIKPGMMIRVLAKSNRLSQAVDIARVKTTGKRFYGEFATCFVVNNEQDQPFRMTFIVSKKTAKLAVDRNRTKRLLREAVKSLLPQVKPGISVVCIAKTNLDAVPLPKVTQDITHVFRSAQILKP